MKANDLKDLNDPPKILLHGDAGTGKTALVSQLTNGYLMDLDGGMKTALTLEDKFTKYRHNIEFDTFKDKSFKNARGYELFYAKLLKIADAVYKKTWKYDALAIDSMTGLAQIIKHFVMNTQANDPLAEPKQNHWGAMVNCMESVCAIIQSLEIPVFLTAHDTMVQTDDDVLYRILGMTKNHGEKIPWMFDEVWLTKVKKKGTELEFIVSGKRMASRITRTRTGFTTDVSHKDIGLPGVFEKIGFKYDFNVK
jgi:archaellum biogenesis ATPase FlaH